ncbi:MAG: DVUA0089 family protein [Treponema sp.]|jgi:hypothetical protein|nr:DVUA0089 family protein [Treponema sp.]
MTVFTQTLRKTLFTVLVLSAILPPLYGQSSANSLSQLDSAIRTLGADISTRLNTERAQKVGLGQWAYRDTLTSLGSYWQTQLMEELTNVRGRSFSLSLDTQTGADWLISGEIIEVANVIRVYTRLTRVNGNAVAASLHSDFEYNQFFADMLAGGSGSSPSLLRDAYEFDSMEAPLAVTLAASADGPLINRNLHNGSDEDFFLLTPAEDSTIVMETTGDTDTYLELYESGSTSRIANNDDGGSGSNARIRHSVRAGVRYIAKVRGYSNDTGSYGFRAYITEGIRPDEYEEDNSFNTAKLITIGTAQQHTFHNGDDVDWVKFQVTRSGRYVIRARGVNSARLDTVVALYDSSNSYIDEDDDGGEDMDARLSAQLQSGTYYVKVSCLNDDPDQPYTVRVDAE